MTGLDTARELKALRGTIYLSVALLIATMMVTTRDVDAPGLLAGWTMAATALALGVATFANLRARPLGPLLTATGLVGAFVSPLTGRFLAGALWMVVTAAFLIVALIGLSSIFPMNGLRQRETPPEEPSE